MSGYSNQDLFDKADKKLIEATFKIPDPNKIGVNIARTLLFNRYGVSKKKTTALNLDQKSRLLVKLEQYVTKFLQDNRVYTCLPGDNNPPVISKPRDLVVLISTIFDSRYTPALNQLVAPESVPPAYVGKRGLYFVTKFCSKFFVDNFSNDTDAFAWNKKILEIGGNAPVDVFFRINDTIDELLSALPRRAEWVNDLIDPGVASPIATNLICLRAECLIARVVEKMGRVLKYQISAELTNYERLVGVGAIYTKDGEHEKTKNSIIISGKMIYRYGRIFDILQKTTHGTAINKIFTDYIEEALSNSMNYLCRIAGQDYGSGTKLLLLGEVCKWYLTSCAISTPFLFENLQSVQGRPMDTVADINEMYNPTMTPLTQGHATPSDEFQELMLSIFRDNEQLEQFFAMKEYFKNLMNTLEFDRASTMPDIVKYYDFSEGLRRTILNGDATFDTELQLLDDADVLRPVKRHTCINWLVQACKHLASEENIPQPSTVLGRPAKVNNVIYSLFVIGSTPLFWITNFEDSIFARVRIIPTRFDDQEFDDNKEKIIDLIRMTRKNAGQSTDELVYYSEHVEKIDTDNHLVSTFQEFGARAVIGRKFAPEQRARSDMYIFDETPHSQLCDDFLFANRIFPIVYKFQRRTRALKATQNKFELITLKKYVNTEVWRDGDIKEDDDHLVKRLTNAVLFNSYVDNLQLIPIFAAEITRSQVIQKFDVESFSYIYQSNFFDGEVLTDPVISLCIFSENVETKDFNTFVTILNEEFYLTLKAFADSGLYYKENLGGQELREARNSTASLKHNFFFKVIKRMGEAKILRLSKIGDGSHVLQQTRLLKVARVKIHFMAFYEIRNPIFMIDELKYIINKSKITPDILINETKLDSYILSNSIEFEFNRDIFISTPLVNKTYLTAVLGNSSINTAIWGEEPRESPSLLQVPTTILRPVGLERPMNIYHKYERYFNNAEMVDVTTTIEKLNIASYTLAEIMKVRKGVGSPYFHVFNFLNTWSLNFLDKYSSTERLNRIRYQVPLTASHATGSGLRQNLESLLGILKEQLKNTMVYFSDKLKKFNTADVEKCVQLFDTIFIPIMFSSQGTRELQQFGAKNKYLDRTLAESYISALSRQMVPRTSTENISEAMPKFIVEEMNRVNGIFEESKSLLNFVIAFTWVYDLMVVEPLGTKEVYKDFRYVSRKDTAPTIDVFGADFKSRLSEAYQNRLLYVLSLAPITLEGYRRKTQPNRDGIVSFKDSIRQIITPFEIAPSTTHDMFFRK